MLEQKREAEERLVRKFKAFSTIDFWEGLVFFAMARKTKEQKWLHRIQESLSNVRKQAQSLPAHFQHRLLLFEAEIANITGDVERAAEKYELAVNAFDEYGYTNEQAIAYERAGDFFVAQHDERAPQYYGKAQALYIQWGAQGKADHLGNSIPF
mmetsp:Transcript_4574/g.6680  ORF Transcript_4574/g.6680 Transcript_4574/m.6680 type:complete len:154 (-) Transcript_4574:572-1033(-)